jgi:hypothetical protein
LRVVASVQMDDGEVVEAQLPDRETAAILPRSILLADSSTAPASLLDTLAPIVVRMCDGRRARIWTYRQRRFFSFASWRSVPIVQDTAPAETPPDARGAAEPEAR